MAGSQRRKTQRRRLTKRLVDSLVGGERAQFVRDSEVTGFGVKVERSGAKSFIFEFKRGSRSRRLTIGRFGDPWTVDTARREALRLRSELVSGNDPAEARHAARGVLTVKELADRVVAEHWEPKCKPRTVESYRLLLERWILPAFGRARVNEVSRADVARLHHEMRGRRYAANRALATLSVLFNMAERWGLYSGPNPARHVQPYREQPRRRFLSPKELARLGGVLREAEGARADELRPAPLATEAIRLLLFTGCRLSEVLCLQWRDVDLEARRAELRDTKTGARSLPLSEPALEVLRRLPQLEGNPYCLPSFRRVGGHLTELRKSWKRIREAAGLEDVRLHDLRHSHASVAASAGESLLIIGGLLGHRQAATTRRYSHLSDDPLRGAAERTAASIAAAMESEADDA